MSAFLAALPAIMSAATSVGQFIAGATQGGNRPQMTTPQSVLSSTELKRRLAAMKRLPGQDIAEARLKQRTANAIRRLKDTGGGSPAIMGAIAGLHENELNTLADIEASAASFFANQQNALADQLMKQGQYEQTNFMTNQMQPYMQSMAAKSALTEAGLSNLFESTKDFAGLALLTKGFKEFPTFK